MATPKKLDEFGSKNAIKRRKTPYRPPTIILHATRALEAGVYAKPATTPITNAPSGSQMEQGRHLFA